MHGIGILAHIAGLWVLSGLDGTGKYLVMAGVPILIVAFVRYAVHTALISTLVLPRRGRTLFHTRSLKRQLLRGGLMLLTSLMFFSVLKRVPLAEATALNFMAPVFVMGMAPWLLSEPHRLHRWLGVLLAFCGMLIVVRPGGQVDSAGMLLGMGCALTFALFQIATRYVAHDDPMTTNFYGGLCGTVGTAIALPWADALPPLQPFQWAMLISTGVIGCLGHWLQAAAFSKAPATLLAPYSYMQIISAATLGWLMFGQFPDATTGLGIALICVAGLGVVLVERWRLNVARASAAAP